jgi:hypothetical protein
VRDRAVAEAATPVRLKYYQALEFPQLSFAACAFVRQLSETQQVAVRILGDCEPFGVDAQWVHPECITNKFSAKIQNVRECSTMLTSLSVHLLRLFVPHQGWLSGSSRWVTTQAPSLRALRRSEIVCC